MLNTTIIKPFIAMLATILFMCAWGSNHWPQLMYLCHFHLHIRNQPIVKIRLISPPNLLNRFIKIANKSMTFWRKTTPSKRNDITNIWFHVGLSWLITFGCIYKSIGSWDSITRFIEFDIGLTPSPRQYVIIILN